MTALADPIERVPGLAPDAPEGTEIDRPLFVAYEKENVRNFATVAEVGNTSLLDRAVIFIQETKSHYIKNTASMASPDGIQRVVDGDGYIWEVAARELLTSNRTYYVRPDGSDSNNGLADTAGGAFLTIPKAIDVAASLDLGIYNVTIKVADGTYTAPIVLKSYLGAGTISIVGNTTTAANVLISTTAAHCIIGSGVRGAYTLSGMKTQANTSGYGCIVVSQGTRLTLGNGFEFGAAGAGGIQMSATYGASIICATNYTISGGGGVHMYATTQGLIQVAGRTVTLSGTPAFSAAFALATQGGGILANGNTYSGSATGARYSVSVNAWIDTLGGGASYLPGNSAGSAATGGQYN